MTALDAVRRELATNERQWAAFSRLEDTLVVAPPGSGKTKLLTAKLAHDFLTNLPSPHGAACITYSNAAASELEARLEGLHVEPRSNLFVGTVHSFALRGIITPYGPLTGFDQVVHARVASDAEQERFIQQAIAEIYAGEPSWGVDAAMRRRRAQFLTPDIPDPGGPRIAEVAQRYADQLEENGLIDFDDMIRVAVEIVEGNEWVRRVLAARFSKLYIDEYQDLAPGLHRLVVALCFDQSADATLFAVADPDQCIYAFTGADPELLKDLERRSSVTTIRLLRNYRCGDVITRKAVTALDYELEYESDRGGG
jgi:DNA helicase II / ATP-dependent DNA helicase PcrA